MHDGTHRRRLVLAIAAAVTGTAAGPARAADDPGALCDQAAARAEQAHGLPSGILSAIGRVESGRRGPDGVWRAWPWTLDAGGSGAMLASRAEAVAAVAALQARGVRNIDVGCFQVNLQQHPDAFPDLDRGFDPDANADYAARFLASLQLRSGNWGDAVMAYHSAVPGRGLPYRAQVMAAWQGGSAPTPVIPSVSVPGLHIWTPVTVAGTAVADGRNPYAITLTASASPLPVVHVGRP